MNTYIDRFLLPAQSYLNLTNSDHASAESQNLAMVLLSNANLSQETFASVMASLVLATKGKSDKVTRPIIIDKERMGKLITILGKLDSSPQDTINLVEDERISIKECLHALRGAIGRHQTAITDSALSTYISLSDAVTALEEVSIDQKDIRKPAFGNIEPHASAFLAHTTLARRFQRRHHKKRHLEEGHTVRRVNSEADTDSGERGLRTRGDKKARQNYRGSNNHPGNGSGNRNKAANNPHYFQ